MPQRVLTGCRDCKRCTNSVVASAGRKTGRASAALMTGGLSELVMASRKKCRICGHQLSLHGGAEARTVQPAVEVKQAGAGPPPGWYDDPNGPGERWWDGTRWTEHHRAGGHA